MGSMTEVMRRLREQAARAATDAPEQEQPPQTEGGPPATPGPAAAPEPARPREDRPAGQAPRPASGFVQSGAAAEAHAPPGQPAPERAGPPPVRPGLGAETVAWDARRVDPVVVAFHDRCSGICEQYRSVRARLLTMNSSGARQVIAITSSVPQEGKSVTAINLALVMAEGGEHSILLADADFRRTSLARMLGVRDRPGLVELIGGQAGLDDVLQHTPYPNLKFIPGGASAGANFAELLGSPAARAAVARFRGAFDYTFLDTPPVTTVADVCTLAPHCDGTIVVIEMRRTPEPTVQQAVRTLQTNNVRVLGCLLSRYRERASRYYDRYYYRYYRSA